MFVHLSEANENLLANKEFNEKIKKSNYLIAKCLAQPGDERIFIISFKETIVLVNSSYLNNFFKIIPKSKICFLPKTKDFFDEIISKEYQYQEIEYDLNFKNEIKSFIFGFHLKYSQNYTKINGKNIWKNVRKCISGYLIKEAYHKTFRDRFDTFLYKQYDQSAIPVIEDDEYIALRLISSEFTSNIELVYNIDREELDVFKIFKEDNEQEKLFQREINNYIKISHPFLPRFHGISNDRKKFFIEFINGKTLLDYNDFQFKDINLIIFEMMVILDFLHCKNFVLRDLKPNNIIIDNNKTVVFIDFDRMINISEIDKIKEITLNIGSKYSAPEISDGCITKKSDIYSLGMIINYIMDQNKNYKKEHDGDFEDIFKMIREFTEKNIDKRPDLKKYLLDFYFSINNEIPAGLYNIYKLYYNDLYDKILFRPNDGRESSIGLMYYEGKKVPKNDRKAIQYFSIAANQNDISSQFYLGCFYFKGIYIDKNISKSIEYFTLAANQNDIDSQYNLSVIYLNKESVNFDVKKGIHYLTLAANQNYEYAQDRLGIIYYLGTYVPRDIKKSIVYLTLAANQNSSSSQYLLGTIYYDGDSVPRDMNKAIHYLTLSAEQKYGLAQSKLGIIYSKGEYIVKDFEKGIHYLELALKQNIEVAAYNLGLTYFLENEKKYINVSIRYFQLASDMNDTTEAQYMLGTIYSNREHGEIFNIQKAIHYFELAASKNHFASQFELGCIYLRSENGIQNINKAKCYFQKLAEHYQISNQTLEYIFEIDSFFDNTIF